ncbi:MAG: cysteine desulfurase [Oscillospiraceae bacterium]|nr:cysteine desulfurase [Oscillospiraceae bacterium]MBR3953209.1 cysteine desulfurase [Oscillospiraceae bacterium]
MFIGGGFVKEIYLDNSATTRVYDEAAKIAFEVMTEYYGNPSSLHSKGVEAEKIMEEARKNIAEALGANPEGLYFTSGGTEANNLAVIGGALAKKRRGNKVVVSAYEHDSVIKSAKQLENMGFSVTYLAPDENGIITPLSVFEAVDEKTVLVSVMMVNNEIGAINPIKEICAAAKRKNPEVLFHTDAVQAFCKIPIKAEKLGADMVTVTAHKIGGPKGTGALWIKKGARVLPNHFGGEQEKQLRPGTQAMPLIAAFGKAAEIEAASMQARKESMKTLERYLKESIKDVDGIVLNSKEGALPNIVNISVPGIRSEIMLHYLENRGIYVSSGSACALGAKSHVLAAMGYDNARIDSAVRISFGRDTEKEDIDELVAAIKDAMSELCR